MSGGSRLVTGSFIASGALQDVPLVGFRPRKVVVYNSSVPGQITWLKDMPDNSGIKEVAAGTKTYITSNGLAPNATADGFSFGADATLNQAGNLCFFEAQD